MPLPISVIEQSGASPAAGQVLRFQQGTKLAAVFQFIGSDGAAVTVADNTAVVLYIKERLEDEPLYVLRSTASGGATTFTPLTKQLFDKAGLAYGVVAVLDANGDPVNLLDTFVEIRPNLLLQNPNPPLTLAQLRALLLDRCAADNLYTNEIEFQDAELASAVFQAINWWRETVAIGSELLAVSPMSFGGASHLATGAIGTLYKIRGAAMQRNRAAIQGGGMAADDLKRAELYLQLGSNMLAEFHNWATANFVKVNLDDFCGCSYNPLFGGID